MATCDAVSAVAEALLEANEPYDDLSLLASIRAPSIDMSMAALMR